MRPAGRNHPFPSDESGFTLVEVLVAGALLIVAMLATFSLLDNSAKATAQGRQRDVGNALAQELVERAVGGRYTAANNDMTDVTVAAAQPGPADRLRLAIDPDLDQSSGTIAPATVVSGSVPLHNTAQSWTITRRGTVYTVSYKACTTSDAFGGVSIAGPFDCSLPAGTADPPPPNVGTSNGCVVGIGSPPQGANANINVTLRVLGLSGLNGCVALPAELTQAICNLAGTSTLLNGAINSLIGANGIAANLLGSLSSQAGVSICPASQVDTLMQKVYAGMAASTNLTVSVSWKDIQGKTQSITRTSTLRRPT